MSLHGNYDPDNIFAQILRGDIPAAKIIEDDFTLAFMDVFPKATGHTLVIPKQAGRNLLDTSQADLLHTIKAVKRISEAINKVFVPDGITIAQFNGATAGQTVYHLHFHIIPQYADQSKTQEGHGVGQMADMDELQNQAEQIKAAIL